MKKAVRFLCLALSFVMVLSLIPMSTAFATSGEHVADIAAVRPTSIKINRKSATLNIGKSVQLAATVLPSNTTNTSVVWRTNNSTVATVSSNGKVIAKKAGTALIYCKSKVNQKIFAKCKITVKPNTPTTVRVTGVSLPMNSTTLKIGEGITLYCTVYPENATNKSVNWSSNNTNVATVNNGSIIGKGEGTATVTVKTQDGNYSASVVVKVTNPTPPVQAWAKVSGLDVPSKLNVGDKYKVYGTITSSHPITLVCFRVKRTDNGSMPIDVYRTWDGTSGPTSYDLNKIDNEIVFNKLGAGMHRLEIWVHNSAGFDDMVNQSNLEVVPISPTPGFPNDIYLKQKTSVTCTLSSAAMMLRRHAYLKGNSYLGITEDSIKSVAWDSGGLKWNFSYAGMIVGRGKFQGDKKAQMLDELQRHPQGIVIYNYGNAGQYHAVLLTDYSNGTFYCADPAGGAPSGRIPLTSSSLRGGSQDGIIANLSSFWYSN